MRKDHGENLVKLLWLRKGFMVSRFEGCRWSREWCM